MQTIQVVAGVFMRAVDDGCEVLCFRRAPGRAAAGSWEFPGGKVEGSETPPQALSRELDEELGCRVTVGELVDQSTTVVDGVAIELIVHRVAPAQDWPEASSDHDLLRWVSAGELESLEWAAPDWPAVRALIEGLVLG